MTSKHIPVLLDEAISGLQPQAGEWYLDGTFGRGGHTQAILARQAKVIALDVDQGAIEYGQTTFAAELAQNRLILVRENFERLAKVVSTLRDSGQVGDIRGALFDFGTSTEQLMSAERGFSFAGDGDLDMRMDDRLGVKAKDLLKLLSEKQLSQVFFEYGGEREARKIARAIVEIRQTGDMTQLDSVSGLVAVIMATKREPRGHLHPATKVFQALRIAVNDELTAIRSALPQALEILTTPARVVTIAFHEGEDRVVKQMFNTWERQGKGKVITKHPVTAGDRELAVNSRSRSAKLRIFEV